MKRHSALLAGVLLVPASAAISSAPADRPAATRAVLVSGLGGSKQHSQILLDWIGRFHNVLTGRCGVKAEDIVVLTEAEDLKATPKRRRSTTANLKAAMEGMARALGARDQFVLFLAGHGQISEEVGKLCLPGRDITAPELGDLLDALPAEEIIIVNAASGGADFLKSYLRPGRVIVTAAGYETEGTQAYFAEFFLRGFETGRADVNKDKAIDMLEAYVYGARETASFYHRQYLLERPDLGKRVKPTVGKIYWLVRGRETRAIWRRLYAGTDNILARPPKRRNDEGRLVDDLPKDLDAEPDAVPKFGRYDKHWHNRRILAEHARLDDNGISKDAFFLWKPYKFQKVPKDLDPGQTGYVARRTILGRPGKRHEAAAKGDAR
jgi:hypothetical protein